MNAPAWILLAERSRALVHHASLLMGLLTAPTPQADTAARAAAAANAAAAVEALTGTLATAPELAAHLRTVQRFDATLVAWRRCLEDASPLAQRYQAALLQQAAQLLISCLHVESLAASESARVEVSRFEITGRQPNLRER